MSFYIKQNDTRPTMSATLIDANGSSVDLTGATVSLKMRKSGETSAVSLAGTASVVTANKGKVQYVWAAADTSTVGSYEGEFQVTFSGGAIQTFPNDRYIDIEIVDDIA